MAVRLSGMLALLLASIFAGAAAENWAVLVAGSNGYWNYRHQADVCHAFKTLVSRGFNPDKIITLLYDDVANSYRNPYRGKLYNKPAKTLEEAEDVYAGCRRDYVGEAVTPDKFVSVLTGDAKAAGGRVLTSTSEDNVFINFADHGAVGLIAFPDGVLHANRLNGALKTMHEKGMFKQLVFYLEACESGSMFEGLLPSSLPIYAVTAANARESSWGTYCGSDARVGGKNIGSCLGDLFSVNWMEDTDRIAPGDTLDQQFARVKKLTDKSHVMLYGQKSIGAEKVSAFLGPGAGANRLDTAQPTGSVSSRDAKMDMLQQDFQRNSSSEAAEALIAEIRDRREAQTLGEFIASKTLGSHTAARELAAAPVVLEGASLTWTAARASCHELAVEGFGQSCGWTENRLPLSKVLYQLCERTGENPKAVLAAAAEACGSATKASRAEVWA